MKVQWGWQCRYKMKRTPYNSATLISLIVVILLQFAALANSTAANDEVVSVRTIWPVNHARPGDSTALAIVADIKEGFHINADARQVKPFEDFTPIPTKMTVVDATAGIILELPRYPKAIPVKVQYAAGDLMSFEGRTIIYLPVKLEDTLAPGKLGLSLDFEYQACAANYCLFPKKMRLEASLAVVEAGAAVSKINDAFFKGYNAGSAAVSSSLVDFDLFGWNFSIDISSGLGLMLLLLTAGLGGVLLNFTPCVLPLIPIKIISLSHVAKDRRQCLVLGLVFEHRERPDQREP